VVEGEEDGGLGGDGDEKIKRASGRNTRTPYFTSGVWLSFSAATRCRGGRPWAELSPSHCLLPSLLTAGPKSKKLTSAHPWLQKIGGTVLDATLASPRGG